MCSETQGNAAQMWGRDLTDSTAAFWMRMALDDANGTRRGASEEGGKEEGRGGRSVPARNHKLQITGKAACRLLARGAHSGKQ